MSRSEQDLELILEKVRTNRHFDFTTYKRPTVRRRIERRMVERKVKDFAAYARLLDRDPEEYARLIGSLLIKVTSYFRDPEMWDALDKRIIPELLARHRPGEEIRVWCAGCATGEEAYSVAMQISEQLGPTRVHELKVFGTDADEAALAVARRGIYPAEKVAGLPKGMLERWFAQAPEGFIVRKEIRRVVVFGVNNLVSDAPISRLDLLLCRNVFIYLEAELQKRILARFHYALRRDGVLVMGKSELIPFAGKIFEPVDLARRIYRKDHLKEVRLPSTLVRKGEEETRGLEGEASFDQRHRDVLESVAFPVIATASDGTVALWNRAAARLWGRNEGEVLGKRIVSLNLSGLRGDLLVEKTAAVREGKSEREVAEGLISRPGENEPIAISVEVSPIRDQGGEKSGLLYLVHDVSAFRTLENELRRAAEEKQAALEELQTTNEELQSSNEELETTNEELQSGNEELQTTNEELQSTNEELETTNEELQSANAELDATNRELGKRTEEANRLSAYQRTIIRSLSAGVAVVDPSGVITLWNLAAERIFGVPEAEAVGQRLWSLELPGLKDGVIGKLKKALKDGRMVKLEGVEYSVHPSGATGVGQLSALPLKDGDKPLGAVVLFEDLTRLRTLQEETERLREALEGKGNGRSRKKGGASS